MHVRPRCEKKLNEYCLAHGITSYLPLRRETKIYQRRKVTVHKPVFPGYSFASLEPASRDQLLRSNYVVRFLVPPNSEHLHRELEQIRLALEVDATLGACSSLIKGRRVRIIGGAFLGIEGIIVQVRGGFEVRLNVDMIGQAVSVDVHKDLIEAID